MVIERILVTIRRGEMKKRKKRGVGGGERHYGNQNVFDHHNCVATERFLVATIAWQMNPITI
jgi:hypothetical protein